MNGKFGLCGGTCQIDDGISSRKSFLQTETVMANEKGTSEDSAVVGNTDEIGKAVNRKPDQTGMPESEESREKQHDFSSIDDVVENEDDAVRFVKQTLSDKVVESNWKAVLTLLSSALMKNGIVILVCSLVLLVGYVGFFEEYYSLFNSTRALLLGLILGSLFLSAIAGVIASAVSPPGIRFALYPNEKLLKSFNGVVYIPEEKSDDTEDFIKKFQYGKCVYCTIRMTNRRIAIGKQESPLFFKTFDISQVPILEMIRWISISANVDVEFVKGDILNLEWVNLPIWKRVFSGTSIWSWFSFLSLFYDYWARSYVYLETRDGRLVIKGNKKVLRDWINRKDNVVMYGDSLTNL